MFTPSKYSLNAQKIMPEKNAQAVLPAAVVKIYFVDPNQKNSCLYFDQKGSCLLRQKWEPTHLRIFEFLREKLLQSALKSLQNGC